ncbi:MAG: PIN domain-containing protein [Candidatus Kaiserbacteria bacterium]|nr:MAG: PIN domain-containing protein [Candidatus Kaiserbacteria bacterium]
MSMDPINFQISKFAVFLDTNVLYPSYLRDIILRLALRDTFRIHWSDHILKELREALLKKAGLTNQQIDYVTERMGIAFPDALIECNGVAVPGLKLPDAKDEHVVIAALCGRCDLIVTANTKHFPSDVLAPFGIEVQHPDQFLTHHLSLERDQTLETIKEHRKALKNPRLSFDDYLKCLINAGLVIFPNHLKEAEKLIDT